MSLCERNDHSALDSNTRQNQTKTETQTIKNSSGADDDKVPSAPTRGGFKVNKQEKKLQRWRKPLTGIVRLKKIRLLFYSSLWLVSQFHGSISMEQPQLCGVCHWCNYLFVESTTDFRVEDKRANAESTNEKERVRMIEGDRETIRWVSFRPRPADKWLDCDRAHRLYTNGPTSLRLPRERKSQKPGPRQKR